MKPEQKAENKGIDPNTLLIIMIPTVLVTLAFVAVERKLEEVNTPDLDVQCLNRSLENTRKSFELKPPAPIK
jgi:hypothetical protein